MITAVTLGHIPLVKGLEHHHQAHFVAQGHQFGCRHIVGGTDGITAHILEHLQLVTQGRHIDGGAQWAQVVMVAHALELTMPAIEVETLVGHVSQRADAEARSIGILQFSIDINFANSLIKRRLLG